MGPSHHWNKWTQSTFCTRVHGGGRSDQMGGKQSNKGSRFDIKSQPEIRRCLSLLSWKQGAMRGKRDKSKKFLTNWKQEKKERKDLASSQQPHTNLGSSSILWSPWCCCVYWNQPGQETRCHLKPNHQAQWSRAQDWHLNTEREGGHTQHTTLYWL